MTEKLTELVSILKGHRTYIQTHNFPDPDAIASAYGLQALLEHFGIITIICHHGITERAATTNLITSFGIKMTTDNDLVYMTGKDYIILVDSQKGNGNIRDLIGQVVACVDHHPTFCGVDDYLFKDIRQVGSCSTIVADYYRQNNVEIPDSVATALLYGLKCDTRDFTRGVTPLDIEIYSYLYPYANHRLIRHFQMGELLYSELPAFAQGMNGIEVVGGVAFAYLDFPCQDALIATISDFVLLIDIVNFAVVFDHRNGGFKFSVRSEVEEVDAGMVAFEALKGIGSGGGHKTMAGGYASEAEVKKLSSDIKGAIQARFLDVIKKFKSENHESV